MSVEPEEAARDIVTRCLCMRTRMLERIVGALYAPGAQRHGLSVAQVTLLAAIVRYPGARGSDLAKALVLDRSTLSRTLRKLIELGLVETRPGEGRNVHHLPTREGRERLTAVHADWADAQEQAEALLADQAEAVTALVRGLTATP